MISPLTSQPGDLVLIANPRSGAFSAKSPASHFVELLNEAGLPVAAVFSETSSPASIAKAAIDRGAATVVAAGGDGTISGVASALIGTSATLGVLPAGTHNHFARDMHIPSSLVAAAKVIAAGRVHHVDTAEVNGLVFLNNSGLGLYPRIVLTREHHRRLGLNRWLALIAAVVRTLRNVPVLEIRVSADSVTANRLSSVVLIANNEYIVEGIRSGIRPSLTSGQLFVYVANARTGFDLVRLSLRALIGRLKEVPEFEMISTTEVRIETRRKYVVVSHDGEFTRMSTPLHYRIRPAALRVFAP